MATLAQLTSQRATAGARYAAAVAELRASMVDLAALDQVLANNVISPGNPSPAPTFTDPPDSLPWYLAHPVYAPRQPLPNWRDQTKAVRDAYLAAFTAGA